MAAGGSAQLAVASLLAVRLAAVAAIVLLAAAAAVVAAVASVALLAAAAKASLLPVAICVAPVSLPRLLKGQAQAHLHWTDQAPTVP